MDLGSVIRSDVAWLTGSTRKSGSGRPAHAVSQGPSEPK